MEALDAAVAASFETTAFLDHFKDLPDHRQPGKVTYPLDEVLLLSLLAVLAGAEGFTDIARFGEKKLGLLHRFRFFADGTPSHDHLGDIFATLDARGFNHDVVEALRSSATAPVNISHVFYYSYDSGGPSPKCEHVKYSWPTSLPPGFCKIGRAHV